MADGEKHKHDGEETVIIHGDDAPVESKDRGVFDFFSKKEEKPLDQSVVTKLENISVSDSKPVIHEHGDDKEKKLNRSNSSSSSSSSEEEGEGEGKKKKTKKKKGKAGEEETSIEVEKGEEKKGFLEKIKEKLPGQQKKTDEVKPAAVETTTGHEGEKKSILDKLKEKLPGGHSSKDA